VTLADRIVIITGGHYGGPRERHSVTVVGSAVSGIGGWGTRSEAEATRRALIAALEAPSLTVEDELDDSALLRAVGNALGDAAELVRDASIDLDRPQLLLALALLRQVASLRGLRTGDVVRSDARELDVADAGAE
jgi:hypothetical protein